MTTALPLQEFQELLTCSLCSGFYRDAHTILECMHTFCKSCILKHFHHHNQRGSIQCPQCSASLGLYGHLASKMIYDRDLQSIVDKLFPQFLADEKVAEERFYAERNISLKALTKKHDREDGADDEFTAAKRSKSSASPGTSANKPQSAPGSGGAAASAVGVNDEFIVKMIPAKTVSDELILKELSKRLCKATKNVRVNKLQSFVHKRLPDEDREGLEPSEIKLIYNGSDLHPDLKLSALSDAIDAATVKTPLEFEYCRYHPRGSVQQPKVEPELKEAPQTGSA